MATHPPAPTPEHPHSKTDTREHWVDLYALIAGGLLIILGIALSGAPLVYVGLVALSITILWILQFCGEAYAKPRLMNIPVQGSLWAALRVVIIGVIAWIIGKSTGTFLVDIVSILTEKVGIFMPILGFIVAALAVIGLLLAVSHNAQPAIWICLAAFGILVIFMTQQGPSSMQTPFEQNKQACEEHPTDFAVGCD